MTGKKLSGYFLVSPSAILIFIILLIPLFYTVYTSTFNSNNLIFKDYVGFQNYKDLWNADTKDTLLRGLAVTFLALAFAMFFGVLASLWISSKKGLYAYFLQLLCLVPWFTSMTVSALVWRWLLNSDYGILNFVLKTIGLRPLAILETPLLSFLTLCFVMAWRTVGYVMILVLSGLQALPEEMLEAADVDGANYLQSLFLIKFPNIKPQVILAFIMVSLSNLNNAVLPLTFNSGGPADATHTIALDLYQIAFAKYTYGLASAISVVLLILNVIFISFYMRSMGYEKT